MTDPAKIAEGLTEAQRAAVFPGPGNPLYARGPAASMRALERLGLVKQVSTWTYAAGGRGATLTELGRAVRAHLHREKPNG